MLMRDQKMLDRRLSRLQSMYRIREPRYTHWQDISRYLIPYGGIFLQDNERDERVNRYQDIIDETGAQALDIAVAGMMALRTNPSLKWFKSATPDPDLNLYQPVRQWLHSADEMARRICRKSNTYLALPHLYREEIAFGTGASIVVNDFNTVIHHHIQTAGEYFIATNSRGYVDTIYREFRMSYGELIEEFDWENVSEDVKNAMNPELKSTGSAQDKTVTVIHCIEPRQDRDPTRRDNKNMPWMSLFFEKGVKNGQILRESGHMRFPGIVPRWNVTGGDVWGEGPGTIALGSIRELQENQLQKGHVIDHQADPPVQIPGGAKGRDHELQPGGRYPHDQTTPHGGVRTAYEVPLRLDWMQANIDDVRLRIRRSFLTEQFQPISMVSDTTMRTAEEIIQRRSEILTVLGPVGVRQELEIDQPLLRIIYDRMFEENLLPPPPPELAGMPLDIEFTGPLSQAMRNEEVNAMRSLRMHLGEIATLKPEAVDNYDADMDFRLVADKLGTDPDMVVGNQQVALIRDARNQQEQALTNQEAVQAGAQTAKDLASADTASQNALTDMLAGAGN